MAGMPYPPNLCASVPICGRHFSARMFCVFCVFCGNSLPVCLVMSVVVFSHGFHGFSQMVRLRYWRCGYGRMPYPPNLCASVSICGRLSLPECSVCSACSVGHSLCLLCWCCRGCCTSVLCQKVLCVPRILWDTLSPSAWLVQFCWCSSVGALLALASGKAERRQVHPLRVPPESAPSAIRLRPPSNQIASATQSDCVRHPIGFRSPPSQVPFAARCHK